MRDLALTSGECGRFSGLTASPAQQLTDCWVQVLQVCYPRQMQSPPTPAGAEPRVLIVLHVQPVAWLLAVPPSNSTHSFACMWQCKPCIRKH
jgi:hypothetical protein